MRVLMHSEPGHEGRVNQDVVGATSCAAVLVDGAGIPGTEDLCRHDVAWYAGELAAGLLSAVDTAPSLRRALAEAIDRVTAAHRDTCDTNHPLSPSAAVAVVRVRGDRVEHLVLGDATVLVGHPAGHQVVTDPREVAIVDALLPLLAAAGEGTTAYADLLAGLRAHRNAPGGFWVAKDDPEVAAEAVTGDQARSGLTSVSLLSNGVTALVHPFGDLGWAGLLDLVTTDGPESVIGLVRRAERAHGAGGDDASAVVLTGL